MNSILKQILTNVSHGTKIAVTIKGHEHFFTAGSVVGYAIENGDDPYAAALHCHANGHNAHWFNADAVVISSSAAHRDADAAKRAAAIRVKFDDCVAFEGAVFKLVPANNDNVGLVAIDAMTQIEMVKAEVIRRNGGPLPEHGTVYARKRRGKKLSFAVSGPTLDAAWEMIAWQNVPADTVYVWVGHDTGAQHVLERAA
jgi:hypothetical protein